MSGNLADFSGNIPQNYDSGMGPIIFAGYAADVAQRIASHSPSSVLETASGTGVVTRALRDALPASTERLRRQRGLSVGGARNVLTLLAVGLTIWLCLGALVAQLFGAEGRQSWEDEDDLPGHG